MTIDNNNNGRCLRFGNPEVPRKTISPLLAFLVRAIVCQTHTNVTHTPHTHTHKYTGRARVSSTAFARHHESHRARPFSLCTQAEVHNVLGENSYCANELC